MADGGENGVGGVAFSSLEVAPAEMALGLHMSDHRLDGRAAAQLALDGAEHAMLLAGDEDAVRVRCVVATVSLVDVDELDGAAGEPLGVLDGRAVASWPGNSVVVARCVKQVGELFKKLLGKSDRRERSSPACWYADCVPGAIELLQ